ncbi:hypothetical protein BJ165DRAFT_1590102 [Panaeolus papilionaceus]|nr:hypothetical protein BJ165DRAFT_1590102 [Panaeolus papilionaceus]
MPNEAFQRVKDYGEGEASSFLYAPTVMALQERIERLHHHIESSDQEVLHPETHGNEELVGVLVQQREDLGGNINRFIDEMSVFLLPYGIPTVIYQFHSSSRRAKLVPSAPEVVAVPSKRSIFASVKRWMQRRASFKLGIRKD